MDEENIIGVEDITREIMRYVFQDKPNPYVLSGMLEGLVAVIINSTNK